MPDPDQITVTARQVRILGRQPIHTVDSTFHSPDNGNSYVTVCGRTLSVGGAAVLTSWPATCRSCLPEEC